MVWIVFVMILLAGSTVSADGRYTVLPEKKGEIVQRDGNNVTDAFLMGTRDCQNELDGCREKVNEAPAEGAKDFTDGVLWGALGSLILYVLLL